MKVVVQRVKYAQVSVDGQLVNRIDEGFCVLVGITHKDDEETVVKTAKKMISLRIFKDENEKMNRSIHDIHGKVLSISQFTLYADCRKGRRPGFEMAAAPDRAKYLIEVFNKTIENEGVEVKTGIFGADMKMELLNDGPVTIVLDSEELTK